MHVHTHTHTHISREEHRQEEAVQEPGGNVQREGEGDDECGCGDGRPCVAFPVSVLNRARNSVRNSVGKTPTCGCWCCIRAV